MTDLWEDYWAGVGNEDYLAAKALLDLPAAGAIREDLMGFLRVIELEDSPTYREVVLDWEKWIGSVTEDPRPWAGSEWAIFHVIAALVDETHEFRFSRLAAGRVPEPEGQFWQIIIDWASGGDNHRNAGRLRVVRR